MVTICQQCGDKGWKVALIYCGRCITFAVHRYCLPKIPPTFDEFVHWVCEECEIKRMLKMKPLPQNSNPILSTEGDDKRKETCLDTEEVKEKVDENIQDTPSNLQFYVDQIDGDGESNNKQKESSSDTEKVHGKSDENIQDTLSPSQFHVDQIDGEGESNNNQKESCLITEKIDEKSDENIQDTPSTSQFYVHQIDDEGESNNKQKQSCSGTEKMDVKSDVNIQVSTLPLRIPEAPTTPTESDLKIANDAVDSKTSTDENKESQTPDKEKKKAKKKRKSPIYGNRKRRKAVSAATKKLEETEEVDPKEHAEVASGSSSESEANATNNTIDSEPKTDESKIAQTPNSENKKRRKRKSPICGSRKKRKAVSIVAKKQEETVEVVPAELATDFAVEAKVEISNDSVESIPESEEIKASQTPISEKKKQKKKRKSPICGHRKRRKVVSPASKKKEETAIVDPTEHADLTSNHAIESEAEVANNMIDSNPALETQELDPTEHGELTRNPRVESGVKIANDTVDSKSEPGGDKTLQTPNSAKKYPKRKRKSFFSYGKQKKKKAANPTAKKKEEPEELDPIERAELSTDSSPVNECQPSNEKLPSVPVCTEKTEEQSLVVSDNDRRKSQVHNNKDYIPINSIGVEHAKPIITPIWRGNFSTVNKEYNMENGVAAHLSNKACPKVWEEAKLFANSLCLEMHPKAEIWPKSFQLFPPSDDNIALYFFPADKSHEGVFNQLVEELMRNEIAMRTTVQNAELLIFASMELPFSHRRFQGKYYLWGVFRGKQQR